MTLSHALRFRLAAVLAVILALYAAVFGRQTILFRNDLATGILGIEWLEFAPIVAFLVTAVAALRHRARAAAVAVVTGLIGFYTIHWQHAFTVPLGFMLVTLSTLTVLFLMPPDGES